MTNTLVKKISFVALIAGFVFCAPVLALQGSLYDKYNGKAVKVFVAIPVNQSSETALDMARLKSVIEEALRNRKSIKFEIVEEESAADLKVDINVTGFLWTDHDPIDMIVGIGGTAMDAAVIEDYVNLETVVSVTDMHSSEMVVSEKMTSSVTKKAMPRKDSCILVEKDFAENFVQTIFGKKRAR